jgi:hypothetical protein
LNNSTQIIGIGNGGKSIVEDIKRNEIGFNCDFSYIIKPHIQYKLYRYKKSGNQSLYECFLVADKDTELCKAISRSNFNEYILVGNLEDVFTFNLIPILLIALQRNHKKISIIIVEPTESKHTKIGIETLKSFTSNITIIRQEDYLMLYRINSVRAYEMMIGKIIDEISVKVI